MRIRLVSVGVTVALTLFLGASSGHGSVVSSSSPSLSLVEANKGHCAYSAKKKNDGTARTLESNRTACTCSNTCVEPPPSSTLPNDEAAIPIPKPDPDIVGYPVSRYTSDRREVDPVNTVRPEHALHNPLGASPEEWLARTELAAAYRAIYVLGLERSSLGSDQSAQCVMHRLESHNSTAPVTFLMADWGVWFEEVTASNLLKFTVDGIIIHPNGTEEMGKPDRTNTGCVPVAKAIFEARPDVQTIVHIHPYAVMAVGGLEWGLLPLSQAAFFLWGQVSREDYDFTYESSFEETLASGFQNGERAMLLNHHGMYAVGRDVAEALFVATHLTQACEVQVRTLSMVGGDLSKVILPAGKDLSIQYKDMMDSTDYSYDGSREWPGIVRKLQRQAPDYNT